jgi:hypothetical protein
MYASDDLYSCTALWSSVAGMVVIDEFVEFYERGNDLIRAGSAR